MQKASLAAGCFWGTQKTFSTLKGVISTAVGYEGGSLKNPTYKDICTGQTGHAETVEILFDEKIVSYEDLLTLFWKTHDPTTLNSQGPDRGTQYRSVIFFHTPEQEKMANASKERLQLSNKFTNKIVTEIIPAPTFYKAEDYHQDYLKKQAKASH